MKVFGRTVFYGYRLQPGELAALPAQNVPVEVFKRTADTWGARSPTTRGEFKLNAPSAATAVSLTAALFERQVTPWEWVDEFGDRVADQAAANGQTHLIEGTGRQPRLNADHLVAVCGEVIHRKHGRTSVTAAACTQCKQLSIG